jgi:iron complex transport system ATP-binding protein
VLHDLNLAALFAPRVVVLHDGEVAADGSVADTLTPALIERVFGVRMDLARTADGEAHLVLSPGR